MISLFLLPPLWIGYLAVHLLLPGHGRSWNLFAVKCCLGIAVGFGLTSAATYFLLVSGSFSAASQLFAEAVLAGLLMGLVYYRSRRPEQHAPPGQQQDMHVPSRSLRIGLVVTTGVALSIAAAAFAALSSQSPHGVWDGWAIWNLRARFLFRGAAHWTDAFSKEMFWSHSDYPLLIPTSIARGWVIVGHDTVWVPILLAAVFTFGIIGLIMAALDLVRDRSQALLAGAVLSATPFFLSRGAAQEADVALAFYLLSFVVILAVSKMYHSAKPFVLLGLVAGLAAWVKNEGAVFLLCASLSLMLALPIRRLSLNRNKLICFFSGLLPGVFLLVHFKTQLAPQSDLFTNQSAAAMAANLLDVHRHFTVFKEFMASAGSFGEWLVSLPTALLLYVLMVGRSDDKSFAEPLAVPLTLLIFMTVGYYFVYIVTPYDLDWHLRTSLNRLLLQLWPSTLFLYFRLVRTPQEIEACC